MKIAIIGTGLMGSAMAEAMLAAGHDVLVYNRTVAKTIPLAALGARVMKTPAEAIKAAEATILVLLDGKAVHELLSTATTKAVLQGKKLINASTTSAQQIIDLAKEVSIAGANLAEVTIQVANQQLRDKQGQFSIGCSEVDEPFWTKLLLSAGTGVTRVGEVGAATKAEAPTLMASMFMTVSAAHAVAIAKKMHIPIETYEPLLKMTLTGAEYLLPQLMARRYDNIFASVDSYISGLKICIQTAESEGMPSKILKDMLELFESAARRGYAHKDGSAILEVLLEPDTVTYQRP